MFACNPLNHQRQLSADVSALGSSAWRDVHAAHAANGAAMLAGNVLSEGASVTVNKYIYLRSHHSVEILLLKFIILWHSP